MRFTPDFIDKVRDANNIVDLFSEFTQLKRNGGRLMGICPFPSHVEKTPSFSVSEDKQVYHCFGCQRSGQIFTALQELKGLSFPEAVEYLANRAGIMMPQDSSISKADLEAKARKEMLLKINKFTAQFFNHQLGLDEAKGAREYCNHRGLTSELVELFQIGYAHTEWDILVQKLLKEKVPLEKAAELGLVRKRKEGDGFYDIFRGRLMFPIFSQKGECIGFGGRTLSNEQSPKYLNSPESELFQKGQIFYGLNETAKYIRTEGSAIVVEGYMDFLALYGAGFKNVVATLGTALTPYHAKIMKRLTPNVLVLFDGDEAGQNASARSLPILLNEGLMPKAIQLPDELDPDDFIKERGAPALREILQAAPDLFSVVLDRHLKSYRGSAADKVTLLNEMAVYLDATRDDRLRDLYASEMAQKIGVEPNWVIKGLQQTGTVRASARATVTENRTQMAPAVTEMAKDASAVPPKIKLNGAPRAELILLNIALISPERFNAIWTSEVVGEMTHPGVQEMFLKAEALYRQMPNEFAKLSAYLMTLTETPKLVGLHLGEPICSMNDEALDKFMNDCLSRVKDNFVGQKTRELVASLRNLSPELQKEKLEQIMNIQKSKHTLRRDRES